MSTQTLDRPIGRTRAEQPAPTVDSVPMQIFSAVLEDLAEAIRCTPGMHEQQRQLLLGRIDGYRAEFAMTEPRQGRRETLELIWACRRAEAFAKRGDLSLQERGQRIRETLGPYVPKPPRSETAE